MHATSGLVALAAKFSSAMAAYQGFNYGSTFTTGAVKAQSDFESDFKTAQGLAGTNGAFSSARLYTMIQGGTTNTPIEAIPAAISTKTSLLLTLWASGGDAGFANELQALKSAIQRYGSDLGPLVAGISVGSEDLYRETPTGIASDAGVGTDPSTLVGYIQQVRNAISGTSLSGAPVGHVDTWNAWTNGSNSAVIDACDWIGVDEYPYFQDTDANSISNGKELFYAALDATKAVAGGRPIWVTETGWPVSGKPYGDAVASVDNAKTFWDEVGCSLFGSTNVWWYTLQDADPTTPNPSFGVIGNTLTTTPIYDLSCSDVSTSSSTGTSTASSTATSSSTSSQSSPSATTSSGGSGGAGDSGNLGGSTTGSSNLVSTSVPSSSSVGGGSPGTSSTTSSTQLSLATSTLSTSQPIGTGAVSTGSSGSNGTVSATSSRTATPSSVVSGAGALSGSIGAAFSVLMAAILAL